MRRTTTPAVQQLQAFHAHAPPLPTEHQYSSKEISTLTQTLNKAGYLGRHFPLGSLPFCNSGALQHVTRARGCTNFRLTALSLKYLFLGFFFLAYSSSSLAACMPGMRRFLGCKHALHWIITGLRVISTPDHYLAGFQADIRKRRTTWRERTPCHSQSSTGWAFLGANLETSRPQVGRPWIDNVPTTWDGVHCQACTPQLMGWEYIIASSRLTSRKGGFSQKYWNIPSKTYIQISN